MHFSRKCWTSSAVFAAAIGASLMPTIAASATSAPFKHPGAIALDHRGNLWIANQDSFGITEIQASTGKVIRLVNAKADGFIDPSGVAVSGNAVWVVSGSVSYANGTSNYGMVTELNAATGALVRTINLKKHGVTGLSAVSVDAQHVWVTADGGDQVAELSKTTGQVVRVFRGRYKSVESSGIASDGVHVWIPNPEGSQGMVERSAVTGVKLRTISPWAMETSPDGGNISQIYLGPRYVTVDAHNVWTGNDQGTSFKQSGSVTQIDAITGKVVRTIGPPADHFFGVIRDIVSDGAHVWVANGTMSTRNGQRGDTVTELNASNGSLVRVVRLHNGIYSDPVGLASNGIDVWVTDQGGGVEGIGSVIELNASTGSVVRIVAAK